VISTVECLFRVLKIEDRVSPIYCNTFTPFFDIKIYAVHCHQPSGTANLSNDEEFY